jgi:hypothetical protein
MVFLAVIPVSPIRPEPRLAIWSRSDGRDVPLPAGPEGGMGVRKSRDGPLRLKPPRSGGGGVSCRNSRRASVGGRLTWGPGRDATWGGGLGGAVVWDGGVDDPGAGGAGVGRGARAVPALSGCPTRSPRFPVSLDPPLAGGAGASGSIDLPRSTRSVGTGERPGGGIARGAGWEALGLAGGAVGGAAGGGSTIRTRNGRSGSIGALASNNNPPKIPACNTREIANVLFRTV